MMGNGAPESYYGPAGQLEQVNLRFICQFLNLSKNRKEYRGYQTIREGFYLFRDSESLLAVGRNPHLRFSEGDLHNSDLM